MRGNWRKRPLGECVKFLSGGTPNKGRHEFWEGDIPWVSSGEMTQKRIHDTSLHISEEGAREGSRLLPANTVLVVVRGMSLAQEFRVAITKREMAFNQDLKALQCGPEIDPEFLFYSLLSRQDEIKDQATEASHGTKRLQTETLERFELDLPDLRTQRRSVEILSDYDDLIENNQRRIALLEESARLLYREWFVRLRFPGYEHTPIANGLPRNWQVRPLQEICVEKIGIQTGPFGSQLHEYDYTPEGYPVVMPKDIIDYRISVGTIARIPESIRDKLFRHILQPRDIVYGRRGDIGRRAFIGERQAGWLCGTGCMRLRPDQKLIDPRYLFDTLGRPEIAGLIASRAQGAIMPNLNLKIMISVPIPTPPLELQRNYAALVAPVNKLIETLVEQNQKLKDARDLLLPRLMNGQIPI